MKVVIVEDEILSAEKLETLIKRLRPDTIVEAILPSVSMCRTWFKTHKEPDLIFMDIQLGDETSFELFNDVDIKCPIIFTTAYDNYAIQAFKQNSIDYLLKPIDVGDLTHALEQYDELNKNMAIPDAIINQLLNRGVPATHHKERILVKKGASFESIHVSDIAYFKIEDKINYLVTKAKNRSVIDKSIDKLEPLLNPADFYRINRHMILHIQNVKKIHTFFNGRLKLDLHYSREKEVFVSRDRVNGFKAWLDN